jgi:large subunit ribosomal protein L25
MEKLTLKAKKREVLGRKVKNLRNNGQIPAVLYGKGFESINLTVDKTEFQKILEQAGTSTLVNLDVDGTAYNVLIHEPQINAVSDNILHVDLYKVDMTQEIRTEIPLEFVGVSLAVEDLEGNLITNKDALEVECLPDKLVSSFEVDISVLKTFDDFIKVSDIKIPEGINVLTDKEDIIAQVTPPRSEEELKEMEEEASAETEKAQIENIEADAEKEKAAKAEEKEEGEGVEPIEESVEKPADDKK